MKKQIPFIQAEFLASAFNKDSFPNIRSSEGTFMPEIALVGRSNVGKSSLINHLLGNSRLAKTSSTPGKTRSINFFNIDQKIVLVDLPGYGYAKVPKKIKEEWADLIDHYLKTRSNLKLILFLLDSRREPTEEDLSFVKWASFHQKTLLLIFTKADKLTEKQKKEASIHSLDLLKNFYSGDSIHFLHYSIKDATARIKLIEKINLILKKHGTDQ